MNILNNDYLILFIYILFLLGYSTFLDKKKLRQISIVFLIFLTIPYIIYVKDFFLIFNFKLYYILIGIIFSPFITWLTYIIVFKEKLKVILPKANFSIIISSALEEFIWRNIILSQLIILTNRLIPINFSIILSIIISSMFFTLVHRQKTAMNYIEMFLFTLVISVGYLLFSGMHIGLHIGRNSYIHALKKEDNSVRKSQS